MVDPEIIEGLKGIETSLDWISFWIFLILVFKNMGTKAEVIYNDPRRKP